MEQQELIKKWNLLKSYLNKNQILYLNNQKNDLNLS